MRIFSVSGRFSRVCIRVLPLWAATVFSLTNPAFSQGAAPLTPESEWKVSDIRDAKKSSESYCTLTRGFTKDVVLTIARNQRDETSLAFDFRKQAFAPGKTYTVAMNAGPSARRAFEARPVSPSALVITTGQDEPFYAGIRKNGKLDVSISGDIYSFNIDGLGAAMDRLSGCVDDLRQAKADPSSILPREPGSRPGKNQPVEQTAGKTQKSDLAALREENRRLSETLAQERRSYENSAMGGKDSNALIELKEKLVLLEKENARLRADGNTAQKNEAPSSSKAVSSSPATQALSEDIATLRAENARLRKSLADEKSTKVEVPEAVSPKAFTALREQYEEQKRENERLRKDIESARTATESTSVPSAASLTQTRILEEKLAAAEKKVEALSQESRTLRTDKEKLLLKKSGDNWDAEEATRRYNEADREARRLSLLLDEKTGVCNEEKAKLEGLLFDPAVTSSAQIAHLAGLEEKLQKANADLQSSDAVCQEKIAQTEKQTGGTAIEPLKKQLATLESERDSLKSALKTSEDALARKSSEIKEALAIKSDDEKKLSDLELSLKQNRKTVSSELSPREKDLALKQQEFERKAREQASVIALLQKEKTDLSSRIALLEKTDLEQEAFRKTLDVQKNSPRNEELARLKAELIRKDSAFKETVVRLESEKNVLAKQLQVAQTQTPSQTPSEAIDRAPQTKTLQELEALRAEIARRDLASKQQADSAKLEMEKKVAALESDKKALQFALSQIGSAGGSAGARAAVSQGAESSSPRPIARVPLQPDRAAIPSSFPGGSPAFPESRRVPFMSLSNVTALLKSANLSVTSGVESVTPAMETTARAFRWESGPLFGSLEERPMTASEQFTDFVSDYLDRTRSHCSGDFASSPTPLDPPEGIEQVISYEIACVSPAGGSSAAVLFAARNGVFSVIANESGAETIDTAIEARDRIYMALSNVGRNVSR